MTQAATTNSADNTGVSSPVIILGGEANALSVARSFGRMGVTVYAISESGSCVRNSRYSRWIPVDDSDGAEKSWARFLTGPEAEFLAGSVLLACSDAAIRVINREQKTLSVRFKLDACNPAAQLAVLDKLTTYQHAVSAGVTTPKFWVAESRQQVVALRDQLVYPLLVKPRLSHLFEQHFGRKHVTVTSYEALLAAYDVANGAGMEVMLVEQIPGGDTELCSYYTYIDETGTPLFDFTKRIIRRHPAGMGSACYHITDWVPQIVEPSLRLLKEVGLVGLANIEFKRDHRDGKYKLIECNARFTASNCLVAASGFDLARFVYNRMTGRIQSPLKDYTLGMRLWDPARDFLAFLDLRRVGKMTFGQWIASITHWHTWQFFAWDDPMPAITKACRPLKKLLTRKRAIKSAKVCEHTLQKPVAGAHV